MNKKQKSPTLRHRLEYIGIRILALCLNMLPLTFTSALMGLMWQIFARFNYRHTTVLKNLRQAFPGKSDRWIKNCASHHWNNLGRTFAEGLCLVKFQRQKQRINLLSDDLLTRLKAKNQGCVFVSLHMGNWEIIVMPALDAGFQMAGIYQRATNPLVENYLKQVRLSLYPGGLYAKNRETPSRIIRWIRQGHSVCMMGDLRAKGGPKVPFFADKVPSNPFPALMAEKLKAPLIAACCRRKQGVEFEIEAIEIPLEENGDHDARVYATTARIHTQFENWIRQNPEQWMWGHRRR